MIRLTTDDDADDAMFRIIYFFYFLVSDVDKTGWEAVRKNQISGRRAKTVTLGINPNPNGFFAITLILTALITLINLKSLINP